MESKTGYGTQMTATFTVCIEQDIEAESEEEAKHIAWERAQGCVLGAFGYSHKRNECDYTSNVDEVEIIHTYEVPDE